MRNGEGEGDGDGEGKLGADMPPCVWVLGCFFRCGYAPLCLGAGIFFFGGFTFYFLLYFHRCWMLDALALGLGLGLMWKAMQATRYALRQCCGAGEWDLCDGRCADLFSSRRCWDGGGGGGGGVWWWCVGVGEEVLARKVCTSDQIRSDQGWRACAVCMYVEKSFLSILGGIVVFLD